ncbi:hypothetical protein Tco_0626370 [Tanacetum coccineum]|uniref:Uncharacterized protein n=1 Tax=Tanacetum coccineum TaxID=301880 RepID=A0ABQ4WJD6_9ASTR
MPSQASIGVGAFIEIPWSLVVSAQDELPLSIGLDFKLNEAAVGCTRDILRQRFFGVSVTKLTIGRLVNGSSCDGIDKSDFGHQMPSSSVVGSTCATTTLVSSTTHCSRPSQQGSFNVGNSFDMNYHRMTQIDTGNPSKFSSKVLADQNPSAAVDSYPKNKHELPRDQQGNKAGSCGMPKDPPLIADSFCHTPKISEYNGSRGRVTS